MELVQNKYKRTGLIGTILFHGILLLLLIIFGLYSQFPPPGDEGVLISFGDSPTGMGLEQPSESSPASAAAASVPEVKETPVLTQEHEESVALPKKEEVKPKPKPEKKPWPKKTEPSKSTTNTTKVTEPEKPRTPAPGTTYQGPKKNSTSQGYGNTNQAGNQGDPTGSNTTGGTGLGTSGVSHSLGKDFGLYHALPKPQDNCNATVVINVLVDRDGRISNHNFNSSSKGICALKMYEEIIIPAIKSGNLRFTLKNSNIEEGRGTITVIFQSN